MVYTNKEMTDMHFCYGLANGSTPEALRLYREHFPGRQIPDKKLFAEIHRRLGEDGRFSHGHGKYTLSRHFMPNTFKFSINVILC